MFAVKFVTPLFEAEQESLTLVITEKFMDEAWQQVYVTFDEKWYLFVSIPVFTEAQLKPRRLWSGKTRFQKRNAFKLVLTSIRL